MQVARKWRLVFSFISLRWRRSQFQQTLAFEDEMRLKSTTRWRWFPPSLAKDVVTMKNLFISCHDGADFPPFFSGRRRGGEIFIYFTASWRWFSAFFSWRQRYGEEFIHITARWSDFPPFSVEDDVTVGKFSNLPHDGADFPRFFSVEDDVTVGILQLPHDVADFLRFFSW
jgi:hypothetical protein